MKTQIEMSEERLLSERANQRWENEGGEVLEIAKLKTVTAAQKRQNDESENTIHSNLRRLPNGQ